MSINLFRRYEKAMLALAVQMSPFVASAQVKNLGEMGDLVSGRVSGMAKAVFYIFLLGGVGLLGYGLVNIMMNGKRRQLTRMVILGGALVLFMAVVGVMNGMWFDSGQTDIYNIGL